MLGIVGRLSSNREVQTVMLDQALVSGTNFFSGVVIARSLGPDQFGVFSLAWTGVLFAVSLHFSSVTAPMMSIGPKEQSNEPLYYSKAFSQHLVIMMILVVLSALGAWLSDQYFDQRQLDGFVLVLPFLVAAFTTQEFLRRLCFTQHRPSRALVSDALRYGVQIILLTALWLSGEASLEKMLWIIALCASLGCLPIIGLDLRLVHSAAHWVRHYHFSKWMIGGAVVTWFSGNLFLVAAGAVLGASAAGAYRAAQQLTGPLQVLMQGLDNLIPVRLAEALSSHRDDLRKQANRLTILTVAACAPLVGLLVVVPEPLMRLFFGDSFAPYAYLVPWFTLATATITIATAWRGGLRALEITRPFFMIFAVSAALCMLTAEFLVRQYGLQGAVLGVVAVTALQQSYFAVLFYKNARRPLVTQGGDSFEDE